MNEEITTKQRIIAAAAHVGFYLGGLGFLVLPFLIKTIWSGDDFISGHAKQALYMQVGALVVSLLAIVLAFVLPPMMGNLRHFRRIQGHVRRGIRLSGAEDGAYLLNKTNN